VSLVRAVSAVAAILAMCVALPSSAAALDPPAASCNGGGCGGWFRSNVTVSWSYNPSGATGASGCGATTVTADTSGDTFTCTVNYGGSFVGSSVTVMKDSSPPGVTASASRGPDANGWYTSPVGFSFTGEDGASGVASCTSATYGGPEGGDVTVSGSCTDNAGNTGTASAKIKYDATPPTVAGTPSRKPDANGWYNHPVDVAFTGADPGSGVTECSPTVSYKGPDTGSAKLVGQCRNGAGQLSAPTTVELRYDATPPARPTLRTALRGSAFALSWTAGKDVVRATVTRAPGRKGKTAAVVYRGKAHSFVDRKRTKGTRYWYEVRLYDQAGNVSSRTIGAKPRAATRAKATGFLAPANGAVVAKPPIVRWVPVSKARFYNVQLWRGKVKLLTTWVKQPKLALKQRWSLDGVRHSLVNGSYRLYVWPAFGTARTPRYGKLLGQVSFVIRR
jgi:hypothetical protein